MHIGRVQLPYPTISPNHEYFAGTQYYWDSYFTIVGLIESGKPDIAKAMVDNLVFLYRKFGFMPAKNSLFSFGRSQPPLLTRMAFEVYESGAGDDSWLDVVMTIASEEYQNTWCKGRRLHKDTGLSMYKPWIFRKLLTTYESGWDVSSRFALGRTDCLPVDLNCLLHTYEQDIAAWHELRGRKKEMQQWKKRANERKRAITTMFWDDQFKFFYDYGLADQTRDQMVTVAGLMPLWSGAATATQAEGCLQKLSLLEQKYGIATTEKMAWRHRQWDYPNAWPPLQLLVIDGLLRYGYQEKAVKLIKKWLDMHEREFERSGKVWEKYNVVTGRKGKRGRYPTQHGFSWTNGVYLRLRKYQKQLQ